MTRAVLWGVVAVAVVAVVALGIRLRRSRRAAGGTWTTEEYLMALGLAVSVVGIALPLLLTTTGSVSEPKEVTDYRQQVAAACRVMQSSSNPAAAALGPDGFDRDVFQQALGDQVRGSRLVLEQLWAQPVPGPLEREATEARDAGEGLVRAMEGEVARVPEELSDPFDFGQLATFLGGLEAELRPMTTRFEAAMSTLAGEPCSPPTATPASRRSLNKAPLGQRVVSVSWGCAAGRGVFEVCG